MRKLKYTLLNASSIRDPRKRASTLAAAALEEVESVLLLAKALHMAEKAALEIDDDFQREQALANVQRVKDRAGYDSARKAFLVKQAARAAQTPQ